MNEDINIMPSYDQSVCSTCIVCSDRLFLGVLFQRQWGYYSNTEHDWCLLNQVKLHVYSMLTGNNILLTYGWLYFSLDFTIPVDQMQSNINSMIICM
jgi:hypothetical protein